MVTNVPYILIIAWLENEYLMNKYIYILHDKSETTALCLITIFTSLSVIYKEDYILI